MMTSEGLDVELALAFALTFFHLTQILEPTVPKHLFPVLLLLEFVKSLQLQARDLLSLVMD